ncbi:transglycosylase family protein [Streptomyces ochraceiscleroticus]|uniref:Transglycosylase family protein n=1 Tax=Streptomyces ochraceiscleroticus TaxID=47761 RepID=A0ABW1MXK8_9ACTN
MAASVTGAGLALPLLTAGGAQAADTATWDRVALCESGGIWSANSGNGFYGGLQLTLEMWKDYGGESYAERPDLASRSQQIAVAESILNDRGPDAWPSCSVNAGLDLDGLIPDVDPGSTETPAPEPSDGDSGGVDLDDPQPSDGATDGTTDEPSATPSGDADSGDAQPSEEPSESPSGDSSEQPTADPSDPSRQPSDSAEPSEGATEPPASSDGGASAPGTGRHRGGADDGKGDGKDGRPEGRHASRGGDGHRGTGEGDGMYTVRPGDNLSAIAAEHGLAEGWAGLYDANEGVIGADPDLIQPGQRLDLGQ